MKITVTYENILNTENLGKIILLNVVSANGGTYTVKYDKNLNTDMFYLDGKLIENEQLIVKLQEHLKIQLLEKLSEKLNYLKQEDFKFKIEL